MCREASGGYVLVGLREVTSRIRELQRGISIATQQERRIGTVQEIEGRNLKLQLLTFGDLEILGERQVSVEEGRSVNVRPHKSTVRAQGRRSEAGRIEILAGLKVSTRITSKHWNQC